MKTFKPTLRMASAARRGLRLRHKFNRGGTQVGVDRAHQLAERRELSEADVKSMHSFFARHAVDKDAKTHKWNSDSDPSAGLSRGCSGAATPAKAGPTARRKNWTAEPQRLGKSHRGRRSRLR